MARIMVSGPASSGSAPFSGDLLTVGEETLERKGHFTAVGRSSGTLNLSYFTARKSETTNQFRTRGGSQVTTPTLIRCGLYLIDGSGNGTLVASSAHDATLYTGTANSEYTRSWSAPCSKVSGERYAWGVLIVAGAAGQAWGAASIFTEAEKAPRIAGAISGQSDLPASFTAGSVGVLAHVEYAVILP